jgi:hypothetical protein
MEFVQQKKSSRSIIVEGVVAYWGRVGEEGQSLPMGGRLSITSLALLTEAGAIFLGIDDIDSQFLDYFS